MLNKALTLSIVIPVYNEENHLKACLDSIACQTVKVVEVVVVDNNSTDSSLHIARSYPFVKLISEKRQGQVFAQAKGLDYAQGEILGRIDADSILPDDWAEKTINFFTYNPKVIAITGDPSPYDIVLKRLGVAIFHFYHSGIGRIVGGSTMLWGANCAMRATGWRKIRKNITLRPDIWEDYDMAFLLSKNGGIRRIKNLVVECSFRAVKKPLGEQLKYQYRSVKTFRLHTGFIRSTIFLLLKSTIIFVLPVIILDKLLMRAKRL